MFTCGRRIWKVKPILSASLRSSKLSISNEPLQKASKPAAEAVPKLEPEKPAKADDRPARKPALDEHVDSIKPSSIIPRESSLMERKDYSESLLNVDSFDEVPGPEMLRRLSSVWQYMPALGCQATVSTILSIFKFSQFKNNMMGNVTRNRPFSRLFQKYGPIVKLQGPLGAQIVLICRPEHIAKVFDQEGKYPVRSTLDSVEKCRSVKRKTTGGTFNLSGIEWEEMRKAIEEPLMRSGEKYFQPIREAADMFVKRIHTILNRQNEVGDSFMTEITKWSMECLCVIALDKSLGFLQTDNTVHGSETNRLLKAVAEATDAICKCEGGFQLWRFMNTPAATALTQACETIDSILSKHIRYAQVNLARKKEELNEKGKTLGGELPFIESLLLNECMTPEEVLTCILDLLLIGVNTSSTALGFFLYHLAQNQRVQRTLFKELKESMPQKQSELDFGQLSAMPYLQACLKESLRLKMPMPILTRVLAADVILNNFRIPKGTYMVMDAQAACLKETDFEKADRFMPERWTESPTVHPFAFLPFGYGLRSCVGRYLAETQIKICVAYVLRNFQIEYNYGEIYPLQEVISFPSKPLRLSFIEREE